MDKLIDCLFRQTTDGATYLQIIILAVLMFLIVYLFIDTTKEIVEIMKGEYKKEDDENEKSV